MTQPTQEQLKKLIDLYQSGKLDEAESESQNLLKQFPEDITCLNILGVILGFIACKTQSVLPALILHGMNNAMAMLFAFVDLEKNNLYIWNGHVAPWFILFAIYASYYGFKGINRIGSNS